MSNKVEEALDVYCGIIRLPYNSAAPQFRNAGHEIDDVFGGDCRYLSGKMREKLLAIGINSQIVVNEAVEAENHKCNHAVIAQIDTTLWLFSPRAYHTSAIRLDYESGQNATYNCYPFWKGNAAKITVQSTTTGSTTTTDFPIGGRKGKIRIYNPNTELLLLTDHIVASRAGRTLVISCLTDEKGIVTLSYNMYDNRFSIRAVGGAQAMPILKISDKNPDQFKEYGEKLERATNIPLDKMKSHLEAAGQLFFREFKPEHTQNGAAR